MIMMMTMRMMTMKSNIVINCSDRQWQALKVKATDARNQICSMIRHYVKGKKPKTDSYWSEH